MANNPYRLDWIPDLSGRVTDAYLALADALSADIRSGLLKPGQKLPPQRLLAYTLKLNPGTVHKAYALVMKRGLVVGEIGRGSFVRTPASGGLSWPNENPSARAIDFCDNYPCPHAKLEGVRQALAALGDESGLGALLQYQQNSALPAHQATGAGWLTRFGIQAEPEKILLTSGALHAGFIALLAMCRAGDTLLVEETTSQAIKGAAARLKLRLRGVRMDRQGLVPDHLEEILRAEKIAAAYFVPTLHNPTATLLPLARRRKVAALLAAYGVPFIEDDIFAPLLEKPLPPLASLAPDFGFYIAGLSKALAPALRLAYLKVPERFHQDTLASLRVTSWMASPLLAELAGKLIHNGTADTLIRSQRAEIARRQTLAASALRGLSFTTHPQALHLWLSLPEPWRAVQFRDVLRRREVLVESGDSFVVDRNRSVHAVRVALGTPLSVSRVREGLALLRETLQRGPFGD